MYDERWRMKLDLVFQLILGVWMFVCRLQHGVVLL